MVTGFERGKKLAMYPARHYKGYNRQKKDRPLAATENDDGTLILYQISSVLSTRIMQNYVTIGYRVDALRRAQTALEKLPAHLKSVAGDTFHGRK